MGSEISAVHHPSNIQNRSFVSSLFALFDRVADADADADADAGECVNVCVWRRRHIEREGILESSDQKEERNSNGGSWD
ncbi:hypothetical protein BT93_G1876 [Corymbia citriodora subsp. variegata]|nr:hypothetical protein BT93_G1876 [Corymbia citriodora subsp. variegata]